MNIEREKVVRLREMLSAPKLNIAIVSHTNPDGDAIGSSIAWAEALRKMGHTVHCITPNKYPYYLDWIDGASDILIHKYSPERCEELVMSADLIFCLDFNSLPRLEDLSAAISANQTAKLVLIDHHLTPDSEFTLQFSYPHSSSTSFLVYKIIEEMCGWESISLRMAEALYVGMMTDTGNFSFSFLTPDLYRAVANLVEIGVDVPQINNKVYNSYTEGRARLFGYAIHRKMEIMAEGRVAYMSLTESEMRRYNFQQGDSEGFVNYALTIKTMKISAMFTVHRKFIRVSLRSRGSVDVNVFARKYFNGGGHKNAAGGKSFSTINETIDHFKRSITEFIADGGLDENSCCG